MKFAPSCPVQSLMHHVFELKKKMLQPNPISSPVQGWWVALFLVLLSAWKSSHDFRFDTTVVFTSENFK